MLRSSVALSQGCREVKVDSQLACIHKVPEYSRLLQFASQPATNGKVVVLLPERSRGATPPRKSGGIVTRGLGSRQRDSKKGAGLVNRLRKDPSLLRTLKSMIRSGDLTKASTMKLGGSQFCLPP